VNTATAHRTVQFVALLILLATGGCKDLGVNETPSGDNVRLGVIPPATVLGKPTHEVLHIVSAKLLVYNLSLTASGSGDTVVLRREPFAVELDLSARIKDLWTGRIPPGAYGNLSFELLPPDKDASIVDSAFIDRDNDTLRYSIVVSGLYHETPFVFRSRESYRAVTAFPAPVSVPNSGVANLTLRIDPYAWFTEGPLIYDPFNQTRKIEDRIRDLIPEAFHDDNRDGEAD